MSDKLIGRFYFKKTANGNLIGEYSNRDPNSKRIYAEAATRTGGGSEWIGEYKTTWCEAADHNCLSADLKIAPKRECGGLFILRWYSPGGSRLLFYGEAMLCDDMLVGDYTSES